MLQNAINIVHVIFLFLVVLQVDVLKEVEEEHLLAEGVGNLVDNLLVADRILPGYTLGSLLADHNHNPVLSRHQIVDHNLH
ncbi:hypothetical protein NL526_28930, partial [Klebsiella pneumoniae]|nr:hypothetical protein [Klebsiella pneumoniae]